jgi:hypothetical protein
MEDEETTKVASTDGRASMVKLIICFEKKHIRELSFRVEEVLTLFGDEPSLLY